VIPEIMSEEIGTESLKYIDVIEETNCSDTSLSFQDLCDNLPIVNDFIVNSVKQWFLKYRHLLSQSTMNELNILRVIFLQFAKDSRTFLKIPNLYPYELKSVPPGFYCHIGIENGQDNQ